MTELTALFLITALSAYVVFGGADFGAGILEATLRSHSLKSRLQATLAPVWEANHVWLIAVIVILFVGFPRFYSAVLTRLYIPISLALVAVLLRGTFFTLRKYDPNPGPWIPAYSALFRLSSAAAPLCFGFVLSGLLAVHPGTPFEVPPDVSFFELYIEPWCNAFGFLSGVFVGCLFGYLASVFFYGEVETNEDRRTVRRRIVQFFAAAFLSGGLVLVWGGWTDRVPFDHAVHPIQISCQVVAAAGIYVMFRAEKAGQIWRMRQAAGAQVLAILIGWCSAQYPTLLRTEAGALGLHDPGAPFVTQLWLVIGLVVVLAMVIPLLVVLYRVFDSPHNPEE